jgi:hypothetical protein
MIHFIPYSDLKAYTKQQKMAKNPKYDLRNVALRRKEEAQNEHENSNT